MAFGSILFDHSHASTYSEGQDAPEFVADLNLDQVITALIAGRDEYNLMPLFHIPLHSKQAITSWPRASRRPQATAKICSDEFLHQANKQHDKEKQLAMILFKFAVLTATVAYANHENASSDLEFVKFLPEAQHL
jgi:hypothetical protein